MSDLRDYQTTFARELTDGLSGAMAPWLEDESAAANMAVYRNNFVVGVADGLAQAYPAVARLVGEKFFQGMAKAFIEGHPPHDPRLALYGEGFAEFIEGFEPAGQLPYLADVARIERAWIKAHYAPDSMPMTPKALAGLKPDQIAALAPGLHGSATILTSDFPALTIWKINREQRDEKIRLDQGGETAMIWRPGREVVTASLTPGEARFLLAVQGGEPLGQAGASATEADDNFDLARAFGLWLNRGAFGDIMAGDG